jgi:hypothetical protein
MTDNYNDDQRLLAFVKEWMVHMPPGVYSWCCIKEFGIQDPSATDTDILAGVLAYRRYRDHIAGPFDVQSDHACHGPYRLRAITVDDFQQVSHSSATAMLQRWIRDSIDAKHEDVIREALGIADSYVTPWYAAADSIYFLTLPREGHEHDWGWVVGTCGLYEFIAITRFQSRVLLIIASDD